MVREWPVIGTRSIADLKIFTVRVDRCLSPRDGQIYDFAVIDSPDWVNIVALTEEKNVVFVRQYRVGTRAVSLEVPGGIVEHGESPESAAVRELREETGYEAQRWTLLGSIEPNPAVQNNRCWSYLAEGCRRTADQQPDEREELLVEEIALTRVPELLARGAITHSLVAHAFQRLDLWQRGLIRG